MPMQEASYVPERVLVVANEHSSHAARMRKQIDQLELPVERIATQRDGRYTQEEILRAARPNDIILAAGGDGTTNLVGNTILSEAGQAGGLHDLPFIPLRGGNANDVASMLNGRKTAAQILREGRGTRVSPLEVRVFADDEMMHIRYALGYFSVGATAAASQRLETVKDTANGFTRATGLQLSREAIVSWLAVGRAEPFKLQQVGTDGPELATDYLMLRGNRIAKLGRPHANLSLPAFEAITSNTYGLGPALKDMVKMQQGRLYGDLTDQTNFTVEASNDGTLAVQYDGETDQVSSGNRITVGIAPVPYRTITTKL